ncbi:MAG: hypothetical protein WBP81_21895, partial [Solirubrobacteraceae bacterium]
YRPLRTERSSWGDPMATHGEIRWPSVGSFDGRLRGDSHGRRHPDNIGALHAFREQAIRYWFVALRRRSQRTTVTWERMSRLADRWLPQPEILHPWPEQRFHARTRGRSPVR